METKQARKNSQAASGDLNKLREYSYPMARSLMEEGEWGDGSKLTSEEKKVLQEIMRKGAKNSQERNIMEIDKEAFRNAYQAMKEEDEKQDGMKNQIKNEIMEEMKNGKNGEDKPDDKAENEDPDKNEDGKAENAFPSESMIKDFSDALAISFKKTPTLRELARIAGATGETTAELIGALNAKRAALKTGGAINSSQSAAGGKSIADVMSQM